MHEQSEFLLNHQTVVVPLLISRRMAHFLDDHVDTPVQTDALLYVSHTLLMPGILVEACPIYHYHLLPSVLTLLVDH